MRPHSLAAVRGRRPRRWSRRAGSFPWIAPPGAREAAKPNTTAWLILFHGSIRVVTGPPEIAPASIGQRAPPETPSATERVGSLKPPPRGPPAPQRSGARDARRCPRLPQRRREPVRPGRGWLRECCLTSAEADPTEPPLRPTAEYEPEAVPGARYFP